MNKEKLSGIGVKFYQSGHRSKVRLIAGILVTLLFVVMISQHLNWHEVWRVLSHANIKFLFLAILLLVFDYFVRNLRWWLMVREHAKSISWSTCLHPFIISFSLNNVLPFRAGDFVRVFGFSNRLRIVPMHLMGTLIVERTLDILTLLMFFFLGLISLPDTSVPHWLITSMMWLSGILLIGIVGLLLLLNPIRSVLQRCDEHEEKRMFLTSTRIIKWVNQLLETIDLLRRPRIAIWLSIYSAIAWFLEVAVFTCVAKSVSIELKFLGPLFITATTTLATIIPSSPGYVGTFDGFAILSAQAYGAERNVAAAFALLTHIVLWFPVTLTGLVMLLVSQAKVGGHKDSYISKDSKGVANVDDQDELEPKCHHNITILG